MAVVARYLGGNALGERAYGTWLGDQSLSTISEPRGTSPRIAQRIQNDNASALRRIMPDNVSIKKFSQSFHLWTFRTLTAVVYVHLE